MVEALKLFVYSRTFDSSHILGGLIGGLVGWRVGLATGTKRLAAWATMPRPAMLWLALGLAWFGAILYLNWRPFDFTAEPSRFTSHSGDVPSVGFRHITWAPFVDYYWNSKYSALDQFAFKALSFLPAGVLMALASPTIYDRRTGWSVLAWACAAAIVVETGRYFLPPPRAPSVTDILIQCAGAFVGFKVTQFALGALWAESALNGWLETPTAPLHFITGLADTFPLRQTDQRPTDGRSRSGVRLP